MTHPDFAEDLIDALEGAVKPWGYCLVRKPLSKSGGLLHVVATPDAPPLVTLLYSFEEAELLLIAQKVEPENGMLFERRTVDDAVPGTLLAAMMWLVDLIRRAEVRSSRTSTDI